MKRPFVFAVTLSLLLVGMSPLSSADNTSRFQTSDIHGNDRQGKQAAKDLFKLRPQEGDLSTLAGTGETDAKSGVASPQVTSDSVANSISNEEVRARRKAFMEDKPRPTVPVSEGPSAKVGTKSPESKSPIQAKSFENQRGLTPDAPNDMVVFRAHDMTSLEAPVGERSSISEPSTISVGNAVFFTANWFAARSLDGGQTFSYVNPYSTFPSVNNGFCCDQVTAYAPNQNMALWGLQYNQNINSGTFRLARTIGSTGIASNVWTYWDFNPQQFGFAGGNWMDFPNMTVGATNLYLASNVFRTSDNGFTGSVVWRIPLSELSAGGFINFQYLARTDVGSLRLTEGAGTTMYWAAFANSTQMRVHRWADGPGGILWDNVNLNAFTYLNRDGVSFTADGKNWAGRADSRPLGAYVSNGVIGVMWMAKQDAGFPQPYSIHARFNQSTSALISQQQIWNPSFAWLYPTATVNNAGNLGGVISYGGGTGAQVPSYPNGAFWAIDDVSTNLPLGVAFVAINSNAGPFNHAWGDYLTVRRHSIYPNTWVAAIFALNGGTPIPRYLWFGRERDVFTPPNRRVADFDGDGRTDVSVYRPSTGTWYLSQSQAGFVAINFGVSGDRAAPADYDGDRKTDIAVYRPSTGTWYLLRSTLGFITYGFGANGDIPAPGDFDGDGKADIAVFRPSTGTWYIYRSQLGLVTLGFGANGDIPIVADYDGDGIADVALFRPSTGAWYIMRSQLGYVQYGFGTLGDKAVPADYDGDGKADIAAFRPSTGRWYVQRSQLGYVEFPWGQNGDRPAPGDFDGDGRADYSVFRPSNGVWYVQQSQLGFFWQAFGTNGDVPMPGAYIP